MSIFENQPIETIRMDDREKRQVIDAYIARHSRGTGDKRDIRVPFGSTTTVQIEIANPGGNAVHYTVIPRNLSRWGMAFLHGRFVYPDSVCHVILTTLDQEAVTAEGKIVHCHHLGSTIHEVGVMLRTPIDLSMFMPLKPEEVAAQTAEMERDRLCGRISSGPNCGGSVLIVDQSKSDRRLCEMYLSQAGYTCHSVGDDKAALACASSGGYSLAVVDVCLDPAYGIELIGKLLKVPNSVPIVAISADDNDATCSAALEAGAKAFLPKPLTQEGMAEQAGRLVTKPGGGGMGADAIVSSMCNARSMQPLLREYVDETTEIAAQLASAHAGNNKDTVRRACRQLKGSGKSYGFDIVTELAESVLTSLDDTNNDLAQCKEAVDALLDVLTRISPG